MAKHTIVLIPGDGIGLEVTAGATRRVLEATGLWVEWVELAAKSVTAFFEVMTRSGSLRRVGVRWPTRFHADG